jgi:hypothetical protein
MTTEHLAAGTKRRPVDVLKDELQRVGLATFTAPGYRRGLVRHIVLLRFAETAAQSERDAAITSFLDLQHNCVREGKPYIRSIDYGAQCSGEGADWGFDYAFVLEFDSEGDRNYYVGEPVVDDPGFHDTRHHAFKHVIGPLLAPQGVLVFDYAQER